MNRAFAWKAEARLYHRDPFGQLLIYQIEKLVYVWIYLGTPDVAAVLKLSLGFSIHLKNSSKIFYGSNKNLLLVCNWREYPGSCLGWKLIDKNTPNRCQRFEGLAHVWWFWSPDIPHTLAEAEETRRVISLISSKPETGNNPEGSNRWNSTLDSGRSFPFWV